MKPLLITLCTYNEQQNIRLLIPELRKVAPDAEILVIDDNSPDGTADAVRELGTDDPAVLLLLRKTKEGLGAATLAGFRYGIEHGYKRLLNMDADLSHNPRHIPELRTLAETHDVAIGSRYVPGGGINGWSILRHLMSRTINIYARVMLGLRTRDNSGSYRCYSVASLAEIDWNHTQSMGYAFQEEVLYRLRRSGCTFAESPIVFDNRRHGETKISLRECVSAVWVLLRLAMHRLRGTPVSVNAPD